MEQFNENMYFLGNVCKRDHIYGNSGKCLRLKSSKHCVECGRMHTRVQRNQKSCKTTCTRCGVEFPINKYKLSRYKNHFCSRSCSVLHSNKHRKCGTRRSKLEVFLEQRLTDLYPQLEIHYNKKDAIQSELDIFIPNLKLAFELNGIFHYEPIHGQDKLLQTQNNDNRKFQACIERGIGLCIIDVSKIKYLKPDRIQEVLDIITNIINSKLPTLASHN